MFVGTFCIGFVCIFGFCLLYIWFLFVVYLFLFVRYLISVCYIFDFCLLCIWFLFVIYLIFVCYIFDFCLHIWFFSGRVPDLVSVLLAGTQRHSLMLLDSGVCTSSTSSSSKPPPSSSSITTPSLPSSWLVSYYHFSLSFYPHHAGHQHLQVLLRIPPQPNLKICFHSKFPNFTVAAELARDGPHHCHEQKRIHPRSREEEVGKDDFLGRGGKLQFLYWKRDEVKILSWFVVRVWRRRLDRGNSHRGDSQFAINSWGSILIFIRSRVQSLPCFVINRPTNACCWDLDDVTLADSDADSILANNAIMIFGWW